MKCPSCVCTMEEGYLFSTKDGAFSFARETPSPFKNAKDAPGFTAITEPKVGGRAKAPAHLCRTCHKLIVEY